MNWLLVLIPVVVALDWAAAAAPLVFLVAALRWRAPSSPGWDLVRGASALNLTVTYVVFALLLSDTNVDTRLSWVNTVVHEIFPIAVMADWLVDPPATEVSTRGSLTWLVYPLAWLAYTMVRGPIAGWYPYPFLNPNAGGWGSVVIYVVIIAVAIITVAWVVVWIGRGRGARL